MNTPKSKKPMTEEQKAYFLDLIQKYSVITSKETNAATNKLKEDAWVSLTAAYNAKYRSFPKNKEQLKLKWDNLKKAARKRSQQILTNNLKTGGGKADFIPPDEILDKIANILGLTCTGFTEPLGDDGVPDDSIEDDQHFVDVATVQLPPDIETTSTTSGAKKRELTENESDTSSGSNESGKILYENPTMAKSLQNIRKRRKIEDGRRERNLAIANYYNKKAEKLDIKIKLLKLELLNKMK